MEIRKNRVYYIELTDRHAAFVGVAVAKKGKKSLLFNDYFNPRFTWDVDPKNIGWGSKDVTGGFAVRE